MSFTTLREIVCEVLRESPNPNNWSEIPNVRDEVLDLIQGCAWFRVYDAAEAIYITLRRRSYEKAEGYQESLNEFFVERGIGWQMVDGQIIVRGEESFENTVRKAEATLRASGRSTAANEIHEALQDLSRRPQPDVTGAIQHGMAALECIARDVTNDPKATLGTILQRHRGQLRIPRPLDEAVEKMWGFASEMGRHIREGRSPEFEEAILLVEISAAVSSYLAKKHSK